MPNPRQRSSGIEEDQGMRNYYAPMYNRVFQIFRFFALIVFVFFLNERKLVIPSLDILRLVFQDSKAHWSGGDWRLNEL